MRRHQKPPRTKKEWLERRDPRLSEVLDGYSAFVRAQGPELISRVFKAATEMRHDDGLYEISSGLGKIVRLGFTESGPGEKMQPRNFFLSTRLPNTNHSVTAIMLGLMMNWLFMNQYHDYAAVIVDDENHYCSCWLTSDEGELEYFEGESMPLTSLVYT